MKIDKIFAIVYMLMGLFVLFATIPRPNFEHWNIVLGLLIITLGVIKFLGKD